MLPHDMEAVWRLTPNCSIYVVQDPKRAGNGLVTLALDDLDTYERRLREAGFAFTEQAERHTPRRLLVTDAGWECPHVLPGSGVIGSVSGRLGQCSGMTPELPARDRATRAVGAPPRDDRMRSFPLVRH